MSITKYQIKSVYVKIILNSLILNRRTDNMIDFITILTEQNLTNIFSEFLNISNYNLLSFGVDFHVKALKQENESLTKVSLSCKKIKLTDFL